MQDLIRLSQRHQPQPQLLGCASLLITRLITAATATRRKDTPCELARKRADSGVSDSLMITLFWVFVFVYVFGFGNAWGWEWEWEATAVEEVPVPSLEVVMCP